MDERSIKIQDFPHSSIDLIYKLDTMGLFLYVNPIMLNFLEANESDLIGSYYGSFIREDKREEVETFYQNQLLTRTATSYLEVPIINTSGKEAWVGQTCQLLFKGKEISEIVVVARDITDKVQAKKHAKASEEKYRNIIENINLGLMEVDLDEKIVFANESFCKMTAYSLGEIIGKNARDIFLVEDDLHSDSKMENVQSLRSSGESSAYELKIKRKDGKSLWMIISGAPVKDEEGRVIGSLGIHNDITDRKLQEIAVQELLFKVEKSNESLKLQQKYLKAINEFSTKIINSQTVKEIVDEITTNTVEYFGFTDCVVYLLNANKDLLSQVSAFGNKEKDGDLINPIFIELGKGVVGTVAKTGAPIIIDDISNDSRFTQEENQGLSELAVPIMVDNEVIGVIDSVHIERDFYSKDHLESLSTIANLTATKIKKAISEEQRNFAELALQESEAKLRSVIDSAMDAVITIDEFGCITEWNVQAEALFGYSREDAINNTLSEMIVPETYREAHDRGMAHFLKTGEGPVLNKRIEIVGLHRTGEIFPIELSIVPIQTNDQYYFSAFIRDIRERKKVEKEMEMALEKERELRELKSKFVSMTSHEFRTPLTTIKSNIELLDYFLKKNNLDEDPKARRNIDRIESQIERLNILMNDILMIGKLEAGKIPFNPEAILLSEICKRIISQLSTDIGKENSIELKLIGKEKEVEVDPHIYEHIITNILSNSLKYSDAGKPIDLILDFKPDHINCSVQDRGIGISKEDQKQLFESFFRADNVGAIQGTGLGLSIVKQFVEMHKGEIKVESEIGVGTTFTISQNYIQTKD